MPRFIDLTGQRYGRLTVLRQAENIGDKTAWVCLCDCGVECTVKSNSLRTGNTTSCGCYKSELLSELYLNDLTGQTFGQLKVIKRVGTTRNHKPLWQCRCSCGTITEINSSDLVYRGTFSCGCSRGTPGGFLDLKGKVFGRLTVVDFAYSRNYRNYWRCSCSCGKEDIIVQAGHLTGGGIRSCGCLRNELSSERRMTHGKSDTRLYKIWANMKQRCSNPNADPEERYYFEGITYCEEWERFEPFMEWAEAHGYTEFLTLDRINPYGNYEPSNCRWISQEQQMRNTTVQYNALFKEALEYAFADVGALIPTIVSLFVQEHYNDKYWATQLKTMSFDLLDPDSEETLIQFLRETYMAVLRIYTVKYVDLVSRSSSHIDNELISFGDLCYSELVKQQVVFDQNKWPLPVVYDEEFSSYVTKE